MQPHRTPINSSGSFNGSGVINRPFPPEANQCEEWSDHLLSFVRAIFLAATTTVATAGDQLEELVLEDNASNESTHGKKCHEPDCAKEATERCESNHFDFFSVRICVTTRYVHAALIIPVNITNG